MVVGGGGGPDGREDDAARGDAGEDEGVAPVLRRRSAGAITVDNPWSPIHLTPNRLP
jgi:hypothetical protein